MRITTPALYNIWKTIYDIPFLENRLDNRMNL